MAKKKYDEQDGVWRTIGGRRVFIRTGQSLGDAMKESGKFKKASDVKREEYQYKNDKLERERQAENSRKYIGKEKRTDEGQEAFNKYAELHERTYIRENPQEADTTYDLVGQHINKEQQLSDIGKEEKTYKVDTTKLKGEYHKLPERTQEEKESDERYANAKAMYKLTGDEKYKKAYQEEIEKSTERIRQKVEKATNEEKSIHTQSGSYTQKELKDRDESVKQMYKDMWDNKMSAKELHDNFEKMKSEGKISEGELRSLQYDASNEARQNETGFVQKTDMYGEKEKALPEQYTADEEDILDRYSEDYGYEGKDKLSNLKGQIDYMRNPGESINTTAQRLVEGGDFLVWNGDIQNWLRERNIKFNEDNYFDVYKKEMGNKIENLYNRATTSNLRVRFKGTIAELKKNTNMTDAEILEYLRRIDKKK